jgi:hypothetical protein
MFPARLTLNPLAGKTRGQRCNRAISAFPIVFPGPITLRPQLTPSSRLGCQVLLSRDIDGMTARLPEMTRNMWVDGECVVWLITDTTGAKPRPH